MAVDEARLRARPRSIAAPAVRPERKRLSAGQRWLFVLALCTFWIASAYTATSSLSRIWPALFPGQTLSLPGLGIVPELPLNRVGIPQSNPNSVFNARINLLIIGVDRRPGEADFSGRTDTIMVATIDPATKKASALSFPRDLLIDIQGPFGVYQDRINASYVQGYENGDSPENGARQLISDMKANFGIDINNWVVMDFRGVENLIDAIGGIDISIPPEYEVPEWWYSDDDLNARWVGPYAGEMHLSGYDAVAFGRYRNDDDFHRIKRQQIVMQAALAQSFTLGLIDNLPTLWDTYKENVRTDLPLRDVVRYAPLVKDTGGQIATYSIGDPVNGVQTVMGVELPSGAQVLEWNRENVKYWISQAFTPAKYSGASVEIQNGYAVGEEGERRSLGLGRYLKFVQGLPVVEIGGQAPVQPATTITLYDSSKQLLAEDIAQWLEIDPKAIRTETKTNVTQPDVVIVIGEDFRLPAE